MLKRGFQFAPGYRLQEFLGRGQFGQVWRATAPGGAATAAKFIDLSDGQGQKEYDGVRRVKQIRHANLMPITAIWLLDGQGNVIEEAPDEALETIDLSADKGNDTGIHSPDVEPSWLVVAMLLGGKSLQARLRECVDEGLPGIPPKELISYMDEAAKGIDFLNSPQHDLGEGPIAIQHSDIKPANIVLIGSSAVVCDFGLARILTRNQVTATSAAGTPAYMAPEAISGKPARTSDQYSLAVTYYHLRTGCLPVNDGSLWEVLEAHRQGKLRFGLVSQAEQDVLRKATQLEWERRFDSCGEMVEALRDALRAEGYTKPSFVPTSVVKSETAAISNDSTNGDPTATLDLAVEDRSIDHAFEVTEPFGIADKSTRKEGLNTETTLTIDQISPPATTPTAPSSTSLSPVPPTPISPLAWLKQNPLVAGGIGLGLVLMLAIAPMLGGGNGDGDDGGGGDGGGGEKPVIPVDEKTFEELYAEAHSLLDQDSTAAAKTFAKALDLQPNWQPPTRVLKGHQGPVMMMSQTSDGIRLVSAADGAVPLLWDASHLDAAPTPLKAHETLLNDFVIQSGGNRLITGGLDTVARVWDLAAKQPEASPLELSLHSSAIEAVAWRGNQPTAATASSDLTLGIWQLGAPTTASPGGSIENQRQVSIGQSLLALASDPPGVYLAAMTQGSDPVAPEPDVLVYAWDDLVNLKGVPAPISIKTRTAKRIAMLSKRPMVVTGDYGGAVRLYEIEGEKASVKIQSDQHHGDVEALRVVSVDDADIIVSGAADGTVCRWQYGDTSNVVCRTFSQQSASCVDVTPDGRYVAAGMIDGTLWLWDTDEDNEATGSFRLTVGASVDAVIINQAQQLLIGGCDDGVIRVWDLRDLKLLLMTDPTPSPSSAVDTEINVNTVPLT